MTTPKKVVKKTRSVSSSLPRFSLQLLGLYLAIAGFFLALLGFVGIFTGSRGTAIVILAVGVLMTIAGVVLGRSERAAKIGFW
jgi:hypothetical protein